MLRIRFWSLTIEFNYLASCTVTPACSRNLDLFFFHKSIKNKREAKGVKHLIEAEKATMDFQGWQWMNISLLWHGGSQSLYRDQQGLAKYSYSKPT